MTTGKRVVVVCGLRAEAKIAKGDGVHVIAGGGDGGALATTLDQVAQSAAAFLSFGVAGGLAQGLEPGDVRVAHSIVGPDGQAHPTDSAWTQRIKNKLGAEGAAFAGIDEPLADVAGKRQLNNSTGAALVDMESHVVATAAARHGIPFAALRVVTDAADRALPHAATVGMRSDGTVDLPAILRSLARHPTQLPSLIQTGLDARVAFAALLRCRQRLGPGFAFLDLS